MQICTKVRMGIVVLIFLVAVIEGLTLWGLKKMSNSSSKAVSRIGWVAYAVWTLLIFGLIGFALIKSGSLMEPGWQNTTFTMVGFWLANFLAKGVFVFFFLLDELTAFFSRRFKKKNTVSTEGRRRFISTTGLALASIPFGGFLYGMVRGRYQFKIWKQELALKNLPDSFIGKTFVQLSDLHLGSFPTGTNAIAKAIEQINALEPDYIFFTGDMINERAVEAEPWVDTLKELKAKFGKYSVLGNHDYGDYYEPWAGKPEKLEANIQRLNELQKQMGFQLLRNENVSLTQNGEQIKLIGLENWGIGFTQAGDLKKATQGVEDDEVQILLSHDPTHWEEKVLGKAPIDISLAGHTHGSQIGIETPAFRWSPVKYRYPRWAGMYEEGDHKLYINRGFGYLGYAGRIGIWPEITLFTLAKG